MQAALVRVEEPQNTWCRALTHRFPHLDIEVLSISSHPGRSCLETVLLKGNQLEEALQFLHDHPHVHGYDIIGRSENELQLRLHLGTCPVADMIPLMGVAPRLPFRARDGRDLLFLIGPGDAIEEAIARLASDGIPVETLHTSTWPGLDRRLTDNQRRVLKAAVASGYYDYPRKITLSALAERNGVAKSTLSEALMVIEKKVMMQYNAETTENNEDEQPAAPPQL